MYSFASKLMDSTTYALIFRKSRIRAYYLVAVGWQLIYHKKHTIAGGESLANSL